MFLKNCGANETFLDGLYFCWYRFQVVSYCFKFAFWGFISAGLSFLRVFYVLLVTWIYLLAKP